MEEEEKEEEKRKKTEEGRGENAGKRPLSLATSSRKLTRETHFSYLLTRIM